MFSPGGLPGKLLVQKVEKSMGPRMGYWYGSSLELSCPGSLLLLGSPEVDPEVTFTV